MVSALAAGKLFSRSLAVGICWRQGKHLRSRGKVDQKAQRALNNRQINNGYIILCVARPMSDCTLEVGVESHDKLYRNPFADPLAPHELKPDIARPRRPVP